MQQVQQQLVPKQEPKQLASKQQEQQRQQLVPKQQEQRLELEQRQQLELVQRLELVLVQERLLSSSKQPKRLPTGMRSTMFFS